MKSCQRSVMNHLKYSAKRLLAKRNGETLPKQKCLLCEVDFQPKRRNQKFCGNKCRQTFWHLKKEIESARSAEEENARLLLEAGQ